MDNFYPFILYSLCLVHIIKYPFLFPLNTFILALTNLKRKETKKDFILYAPDSPPLYTEYTVALKNKFKNNFLHKARHKARLTHKNYTRNTVQCLNSIKLKQNF